MRVCDYCESDEATRSWPLAVPEPERVFACDACAEAIEDDAPGTIDVEALP